MHTLQHYLKYVSGLPIPILDRGIPIQKYTSIDLSITNPELKSIALTDPDSCQDYINTILEREKASIAYGGYLERRNLYQGNPCFLPKGKSPRNVHLGIDFWAQAGTKVIVPLDGKVHSFKNNAARGDYGPTIILEHELNGYRFYTLYGHLSLASIENLNIGKEFLKGQVMATLGTTDINVNYAPHLHFQIIIDMQDKKGDYPGVCVVENLPFYAENCPNPNLLLRL